MINKLENFLLKTDSPTVFMGIGAPGSGKSTYLKELENKLEITRIDADEIRHWLLKDYHNHEFNKDIWKLIHLSIEITLKAGKSVIVDAVNVWSEYRVDEVRLYRSFGAKKVVGIVFNTPLEECLTRNALRERKVGEDFIKECYQQLQNNFPKLEEGFDEVILID